MFPDVPWAEAAGSFVQPVRPPNSDPQSGLQATLSLGCEWLPYVRGALYQLLLQSTWYGTSEEIGLAQQRAFDLISLFSASAAGDCGNAPVVAGNGIDCGEDCMGCCLRYQNGVLQMFSCGVWTDVPGQPAGPGGQPGGGSPQPAPGGGVAEYCAILPGQGQWLLPTKVSTGDTLLFGALEGAWHDTRDLFWNCPDGFVFAEGICGEVPVRGSPDPLPTSRHMSIIANIGGTFHEVLNLDAFHQPTVFTVPGGINNAQVVIQANDDMLSDLVGTVTFCVQVVNNQGGNWIHDLDFTVTPQSFQAVQSGFTFTLLARWVSGSGWLEVNNPDGSGTSEDRIYRPVTGYTATRIRVAGIVDSASHIYIYDGNETTAVLLHDEPVGPGAYISEWLGSRPIVNGIRIDLYIATQPHSQAIVALHIEGSGTDPF